MSESPDGAQPDAGADAGKGPEFVPITSQDDLNKVVSERVMRERAKYADYKDVKAKAEQFDKVAEASKTESQKLLDRIAGLEADNQRIASSALKSRVQAKYAISDDDADLFLTGADEESLTRQAQRLSERETERKKQGNNVPGEGTNPKTAPDENRAAIRGLFSPGA